MISKKVIEQINCDLDGTLSANDKVQLDSHLASDTEARGMLAKLRLIHKKLHEVIETEPPADLKENVMQSLPAVHFSSRRQESSVVSKLVELFQVPKFQMAGMFSLGAAAALLFLVITQNLSVTPQGTAERAMGTILSPEKIGKVEQIDSKHFTIDDYKVDINTSRSGNIVFVRIDLQTESSQPVQLVVSSGAADFKFHALDYHAPNLIQASFGNDFFSAAIAGPGNWVLAFDDPENATESLRVEVKTELSSITELVAIQ